MPGVSSTLPEHPADSVRSTSYRSKQLVLDTNTDGKTSVLIMQAMCSG